MNKTIETNEGCGEQEGAPMMHLMDQKNSSLSVVAIIFAGFVGFAVALICYLAFGNLLATIAVYYLSALLFALFVGVRRQIGRKRRLKQVAVAPKVDCQLN